MGNIFKRTVAMICAVCLVISGEGSQCFAAVADWINERRITTAEEALSDDTPVVTSEAVGDDTVDDTVTVKENAVSEGLTIAAADGTVLPIAAEALSFMVEGDEGKAALKLVQEYMIATETAEALAAETSEGAADNMGEDSEIIADEMAISDEAAAAVLDSENPVINDSQAAAMDEAQPTVLDTAAMLDSTAAAVSSEKYEAAVFDISLSNVDYSEYTQGFKVNYTLPQTILSQEPALSSASALSSAEAADMPSDENASTARIGRYRLFHIHDGIVTEIEDFTISDGILSFVTPDFSRFVLVYTVDFHWGEYTYNLAGGGEIFLSELLGILQNGYRNSEVDPENGGVDVSPTTAERERLGEIIADMSQIESVAFSNSELMKVEKKSSGQKEDDWLLTSFAAFDSEEALTITFKDGSELKISVTDEQVDETSEDAIARVSDDGGNTWTYFDSLITGDTNTGAFDHVKTLSGNVIVELLKETDGRYTLTSGVTYGDGSNTFNGGTGNPSIKNLTIRSSNADSPAKLVKTNTAPLLIINIKSCNTTIENLIIDGGGVASTANGGVFQFTTKDRGSNNGNAVPTATVRNVEFKNCQSKGSGGAVYSVCQLTLENCSFDSCRASSHGGAVYSGTSVYVRNAVGEAASFIGCHAGGEGGAIYAATSIELNDNVGTLLFDSCFAVGDGGALRSPTITMDNNTGDITFTGCYTTAGNAEGGVAQTSSLFSAVNNQGSILFTGCHTQGSSAEGGALFGYGGIITIKCAEDGTLRFENVTANASDGGGAICGWSNCVVTVEGTPEHPVEFENCVAKNTGESRGGGAVYINAGSGTLKHVRANDCKSKYGGAFAANSSLTMTDCVITNCTKNETGGIISGGGAIRVSGEGCSFSGSISDCAATNGGAVYVTGGSCIINSNITGCSAATNGGAVYVTGGSCTIDGNITGCSAKNGSAAYAYGGTFTLDGGEVSGNNASSGGSIQTGSGKLTFKGAAKVRSDASGKNVYLDKDSPHVITADGLTKEAEIHVYVTDGIKGKRGYAGRMFGTYTDDANLDRIINDCFTDSSGTSLVGTASFSFEREKQIAWQGEDIVITVVSSVDGTPVGAGARFELARDGWDANHAIWRGTTDENGQVRIPWTGNEAPLTDEQSSDSDGNVGGASFINDRKYLVRQLRAADGFARPGGKWGISMSDAANGMTFSATTQVAKTNYTQPFAISGTNLDRNVWTIKNDPDTMQVIYDMNASGDSVTFEDGEGNALANQQTIHFSNLPVIGTETVYASEPVRDGKRFLGWNTAKNGKDGVVYLSGGSLYHTGNTANNVLTLYAQWGEGGSDSIARVSFDSGVTWTYYAALITGDYEKQDGSGGTEHVDGAFDAAKNRILSSAGTVIIETLCETHPRYTLSSSFEFTNGNKSSTTLVIRTSPGLGFRSRIVKNQTSGPIIHSSIRYNTLQLENLIFDGNNLVSAGTGGAVRQSNTNSGGSGVFITDCDFINCKASDAGGAVYVALNSLTVKNTMNGVMRFSGCTSGAAGGAIHSQVSVTIQNMSDGSVVFENCETATNGGAINGVSTVTINNTGSGSTVFDNCRSAVGGAVNCASTVTLNNTGSGALVFETCKANGGNGGAITANSGFLVDKNAGTIRFSNCSSTGYGGAVNAYTTNDNVRFNNNNGTVIFERCSAGSNGGAVYFRRYFRAEENAGSIGFNSCYAGGGGGALYGEQGNYTVNLTNKGSGTLFFEACYAKGSGGAVFVNGSTLTITGSSNDKPVTFENCKAGWDGMASVSGGNGGAIYGGATSLTYVTFGAKGDTSRTCTASAAGGAVYCGNLTYTNVSSSELGFYYCEAGTNSGAINSTGTVTLNNTGSGALVFETCKANGGNGGAITANSGFQVDRNAGMIRFSDCTSTGYGGAVNAYTTNDNIWINNNNGTVLFERCSAGSNGGAVYFRRYFRAENNSGSIGFNSCHAGGGGGALYGEQGIYTVSMTNKGSGTLFFEDCYAKGSGGAVFVNGSNLTITGSSNDKPVTFENCKAGWDGTASVSGGNGGAIYSGATGLTYVTFGVDGHISKGCTASADGGAVYMGGGTLNQVSVFGCSAGGIGAAVYVPSGKTTTFKGGRYVGNTASGTNGGAINTATDNNSSSHFDFEGSVRVYDNNVDASGNQRNVVLSVTDRAEPIRTTSIGLNADAKIGIYVIGSATSNPYVNHGVADKNFGTFGNAANLNRFINDRDTKLKGDAGTGKNICWGGNGIVKLTDMQDRILCKNTFGSPAVYGKLQTALTALPETLYNSDGNTYGGAVKLKLLRDVDLAETFVTYSGSRELTLTTAELPDECSDGFPYIRDEGTDPYQDYREENRAYIKRNQTASYLMQINNNSAKVHVENLLIDGNNISYTGTGSSGFYIKAASYAEFRDMTFINMKGTSGSAIYSSGAATHINASDGKTTRFYNCYAAGEGGAVFGGAIYTGQSGGGRIVFDGCSASSNGGAIRTNGNAVLQSSEFLDCKAPSGGAIYYNGSDGVVLSLKDSAFDGHGMLEPGTTNASNGGAIYVNNGSLEIDDCSFTDLTASSMGGTIYFDGGGYDHLTVENCVFAGRETLTTQPNAYTNGGAIRVNANNGVTINNSAFTDFYVSSTSGIGGAIWSDDPIMNLNNVTFNGHVKLNNEIKNAVSGGAVYAYSTLTINNSAGATTSFIGCSANTGGAIFANNRISISGTDTEAAVFEDCHAYDGAGGAIRVNTAQTSMKIANARFGAADADGNVDTDKGCTASTGGGAVYYAGWDNVGSDPSLTGCQFYGCEAGNNGGAFWMNNSPANLTVTNSCFKGCRANGTGDNGRGGAVYLSAGRTITFTNTSAEGCTANTDGGAIYVIAESKTPMLTLDNCRITGNTARRLSSAVHSRAPLTVKGTTHISGNRSADDNGGAINLVTDKKAYFEGDAYVYDNYNAKNEQCNVVLSQDSIDIIHATENGFGEDAAIGVYFPTQSQIGKHGSQNTEFGKHDAKENADDNYYVSLSAFRNDNNTMVGGEGRRDPVYAIAWTTAYKLVLDPNGGEGTPVSVVLPFFREYTLGEPYTKEGYYFGEWNTRKDGSGESYAAQDIVSQLTDVDGGVVTLYAQWEEYDPCNIYFHPNGGKAVPTRTVKPGTKLGLLPSSERDHYTFVRWMLINEAGEEESYSQDTIVNTDLHFYATWERRVTVTFDAQGGIVGEDEREITPGRIGSLPMTEQPAATRKDYEFVRWYQIDEEGNRITVTEDTSFTSDETIYAEWRVIKRRLRYDTAGGYPGKNLATDDYWYTDYTDDLATIKEFPVVWFPDVTNHGYTLDGWYTPGGEKIDLGGTVNLQEVSYLKAKWIKTERVIVTFDSDGGSACAAIEVVPGDSVDRYPVPTKDGYVFSGWYLLDAEGGFAQEDGHDIEVTARMPINENITVKAKWEKKATVSFDSDGGSVCAAIKVQKGRRIASYPKPTRQGYVFKGWYLAESSVDPVTGNTVVSITEPETEVNSSTVINDDIIVKAKWIDKATVTFNWTEIKDANDDPLITTEEVLKGTTLGKLPSKKKTNYILEGWYPNEDFTGEKLTAATVINADCTYYARWIRSKVEVSEPIEYEYSVTWTNNTEPAGSLTNIDDTLTYYVSGKATNDVAAYAEVMFTLKKTDGIVIPREGLSVDIPKYVFEDWNGSPIHGRENTVSFVPARPYVTSLGWYYVDNGAYYTLYNSDDTDNLSLVLRITYEANVGNINAIRLDNETGRLIDANGNFIDSVDYQPKGSEFVFRIKSEEKDNIDIEHRKSLYTAAYKRYSGTTYGSSFHTGSSQAFRTWDSSWGATPVDADKYYYVKWTHGGFSVNTGGDFHAGTSGMFTTTSKEWVPDSYDVVYETADYVVTRHLYSELEDNKKTLFRQETAEGEWTLTGEKEYGSGTISCNINFTVSTPSGPGPTGASVMPLSASKKYNPYWYTYKGYTTGQDTLLDDESINNIFYRFRMTGPGKENLVQKGDTNLYFANPYTMTIRDGDKGDVTYYSNSTNRHVSLGDNDYRFTRMTISLSNADGYLEEESWHSLGNTAYSSWKSVEVWLRRTGKLALYKYTDVYITSGSSKTITLPDDTVGFEIRHSTFYWKTELTVDTYMQINPTNHVKNLVKPDYLSKVTSQFFNQADMRVTSNETGDVIESWTQRDNFYCGKSKTGLRTSKSIDPVKKDNNHSIQTIPVKVTGYNYNNAGRRKPIYTGIFYELLPIGTTVEESSVTVSAGQKLSRSMYNVEYVPDWKGSGQYMMIVSFGVPETIKSSSITMSYVLTNTYENIQAYGADVYLPSAFVNTSSNREEYEILPKYRRISEISRGQELFSEQEAEYGEYIAYISSPAKFMEINVFSSRFDKRVKTLKTFEEKADIIPRTRYEYRMQYGQSINSKSDNVIIYDILDRGNIISTDPELNGMTSAWQGKFIDIQIPSVRSSENGKWCNPVVYYSTTTETDINRLIKDLTNPVWSTTRPEGDVTAIAIDLSKATDGSDFILKGSDSVLLYITMESPADEDLIGTAAVNTAVSVSNLYGVDETPDMGSIKSTKSQTWLMMKPVRDILTLTSNPSSGTADEPRLVAYKDTIEYDLTVQNTDDEFDYRNLVVEEKIPEAVILEEQSIYVYVDDDRDNAVNIGNSSRVSMTKDENGKLNFDIHELLPGEKIHIILPCIVNTKEGKFENSAVLTSINGLPRDEHTDETYHEVKRYDVLFGKKILGKEPEEFLVGAVLEVADGSGQAEDRWTSSSAAGSEYHTVRIGAGEYSYKEIDPPDNYAVSETIWFTMSREGEVTLRKHTAPLKERMIDMYDKYYAVDAVIENRVSGDGADPQKEFSYTAALSGLKARKTYTAGSLTYTADRYGEAVLSFKLKHAESITLDKLPSGARIVVTQAANDGTGGDYLASYSAVVVKEETETALHSKEASLRNQTLTTEDTEADIDRGVVHIRFENTIKNGLPVRFIVLDDSDGTPISGLDLKLEGSGSAEAEERFKEEWISDADYKLIFIPYDSVSELAQVTVPEEYAESDTPLVLTVGTTDVLTCSDESVVTQDENGYIVTIKNKRKAKLTVENYATNTSYYLRGATIELRKGENVESAEMVRTWVSEGDKGQLLYLDRGQNYIIRKTASPNNYEAVMPAEVHLSVDDNAKISVDSVTEKARVFNSNDGILTLYDRYVETLTIKNTVTWPDPSPEYRFVISGLNPGSKYGYNKVDGNGNEIPGELIVDEHGEASFILNNKEAVTIKDLPHDVNITEIKPDGFCYLTEWVMDKDKVLDADDNVSRSTVSPELTGRNTIEVTNKPAVVRVKNKAEGSEDWTEWKYFDAFTNDDHSGAFDYANSLNGEVVIETLLEEHENNTLDSGFEFTNQAITSLTIQSADTLTNEGKHSHLVGSTDGSLLTFNTGGPVRINNLEFDGHGHIQNADGGAINITSGSATLTNVQIHDFSTRGKGAAVYVGDDVSLTLSESEIKHNSSSGENGGAVNVGQNGKVFFEGDVVVFNNKYGDGVQRNVVLDQGSNEVIQVTENGLGPNAAVGVYVTGDEESGPYKSHGGFGDYFGTYNPYDPNTARLDSFVNDRNGLYAEPSPVYDDDKTEYLVRWTSYLTKLTDKEGRLLYTDKEGNHPAVFKTLTDSFAATEGKLYYFPEGSSECVEYRPDEPVNVELLRSYSQPASDQPVVNANRSVTLTTANTNASLNPNPNDIYVYNPGNNPSEDPTRATVTRGGKGGSMITCRGKELTLDGVILDGEKDHYQMNVNGGIVNVASGILNIRDDAVLRNSEVHNGHGGAVYATGESVVNMTGGLITDCDATHEEGLESFGGGIYHDGSGSAMIDSETGAYTYGTGTINISGGTIQNCSAGRGGGIRKSGGVMHITGDARIIGCHAEHGGGVHIGYSGTKCVIDDRVKISGCTATGWGGGIFNHGSEMVVTGNTVIENCKAGWNYASEGGGSWTGSGSGGGINIGHGDARLTVGGNVTIRKCEAQNGGGINIEEGRYGKIGDAVTISSCSARDNGGGLRVESGASADFTGGAIAGSSASVGSGVYVNGGGTLNMSGGSIVGNKSAKGTDGGAVNVENDTARLNFSGNSIIRNNYEYDGDTAMTQQKNIVLNMSTNGFNNVINSHGLGDNADIGIYVSGADGDTDPYSSHGLSGKPFGTFTIARNVDKFRNDRDAGLYGDWKDAQADFQMYWYQIPTVPATLRKFWEYGSGLKDADKTTQDISVGIYGVAGGGGMSHLSDFELTASDATSDAYVWEKHIDIPVKDQNGLLYDVFRINEAELTHDVKGGVWSTDYDNDVVVSERHYGEEVFVQDRYSDWARMPVENTRTVYIKLNCTGYNGYLDVENACFIFEDRETNRLYRTTVKFDETQQMNTPGSVFYLPVSVPKDSDVANLRILENVQAAGNHGSTKQWFYVRNADTGEIRPTSLGSVTGLDWYYPITMYRNGGAGAPNFTTAHTTDGVTFSVAFAGIIFVNSAPEGARTPGGESRLSAYGSRQLTVTNTFKDTGYNVSFLTIDGFGGAVGGATFTIFEDADGKIVKQRGTENLTSTSFDKETTVGTGTEAKTYPEGTVLFEKVPSGMWYIMEKKADGTSGVPTVGTGGSGGSGDPGDPEAPVNPDDPGNPGNPNDPISAAVSKYTANGKKYVVLVGDEALTIKKDGDIRTGVWAEDGILAGINQEDIDAQTGTGPDAKKYAIFMIDDDELSPTKGKAITTPDIATFGVMNESVSKPKVILRKVSTADEPLHGAHFKIFRYDLSEYTQDREYGKDYYESTVSGVYGIGRFPEGTYYLLETKVPDGASAGNLGKVFVLTVKNGSVKEKKIGRPVTVDSMIARMEGGVAVAITFTKEIEADGVKNKVVDIDGFKAWIKENRSPG